MDEETQPVFSRENIDRILNTIPHEAKCCYTGQSILAYCPDPTFDWSELNTWTDVTDVDIFAYNRVCLASLVQCYIDAGWTPATPIDEFKADRIRFFEPNKKYPLQTVALTYPGLPNVNLTWYDEATDVLTTIKRFDMDYLMVGMDVKTRKFADLRSSDHRIANVNRYNAKFDIDDVDVMYWLRQFDRIPKGWSRGIDTRPVARTYLDWIQESLDRGDRSIGSKTRFYAERRMNQVIEVVVESGFTQKQAEAMYHLVRQEDGTWDATRMSLESVQRTITEWLASVDSD